MEDIYIIIIRISVKGTIRSNVFYAISENNAKDIADEHINWYKTIDGVGIISTEIFKATKIDYNFIKEASHDVR